ncbi:hypothetical protein Rhopal_001959-T1 [Rhodotorula paludigena]|uniref:CAP-Gly domain-containing protein n=1 Tax=Rhodotorula paludigena TaxID=86838 RepID=A0AAV5GJX9_9BASI|nr:hypothetical protein Rhopal_001959-T1 [Rhodotorula paludigena]
MLPAAVGAAELHLRCQYSPPLASSSAPASDSTASSSRQLGTILYHGPVPPTKGVWYGIEWDDSSRGKHSGVYDKTGVRYFLPRVEGAGSFLRLDAKGLDVQGRTFEEAVRAKYLDDDGPPASADHTAAPPSAQPAADAASTSQRFATDSNFEVEVVLSDKVNRRFKQLGRLREIGLEWETVSRAAEEVYCEEEQERVEARLRSFGAELSDRLAQLSGFERLTQLQLNSTLMTWNEIRNVSPSLVNLVDLQFGFNRLVSLRSSDAGDPTPDSPGVMLPKLERLNLESNELSDWPELVRELSCLPQLSDLILAGNRFVSLDLSTSPPGVAATSTPTASPPLPNLERLSLVDNLLSSFSNSIDALASAAPITFPSLRRLLLAGNPLLSRADTSATATITAPADHSAEPLARPAHTLDRDALHARLLVLARMPILSELEGSPVAPAERDDAERFWLERLREDEKGEARKVSEQLGAWARERVQQLRKKYPELDPATKADEGAKGAMGTKPGLKSRLIQLRIVPAEPLTSSPSAPLELSVLPTLRTLLIRAQIARLLGTPLPKTKYRLVAVLQPAASADEGSPGEEVRVEIPPQEEGKDVAWWGLSDGDSVEVVAVRDSIKQAHAVVAPLVHRTPLLTSETLSSETGNNILLFKAENLNKSGSFKIRGASYSVSRLSDEEAARGNHAAALSLAAKNRGIPCHIVSPRTAPPAKLAAVRAYGANLRLCEPTIEAREAALRQVQEDTGAVFVPPYDAVNTMLGQGTIFLEAEEQALDGGWGRLGAIVAPVGGGGMLGGISVAAAGTGVRVFGAEPEGANDCAQGLAKGERVTDFTPNTIADGLRTPVGLNNFPVIQKNVEKVFTVSEEEIIEAQRLLWERLKTVVEPSGAVPFAVVRSAPFQALKIDGPICVVMSGGNADLAKVFG